MSPTFLIGVLLLAVLRQGYAASCHDLCTCDYGDAMVCPYIGFTRLPEGYWPHIKELQFHDNNIATLYPHSLTGFPNLRDLNLGRNKLTVLDFQLLSILPNLFQIHMYSNNIVSILPPSPEVVLSSLQALFLDDNNIRYLDPDLLSKVAPNLYDLSIENPLEIPGGKPLLNHPKLSYLSMGDTDGKNIGAQTFTGVPTLNEVLLRRMGLRDVRGVFLNHKLRTVDLWGNEITELLPGTFASGRSIQTLNLRGNPLQKVDLAAINEAMSGGTYSEVDIRDTPLACHCQYDSLYWWGQGRGISVLADCNGANKCSFKMSQSNSTTSN